jgi:purine-binding chemotaxis protein CheW
VSQAQVRQVLEERARALARVPTDQADGDALELVVLTVGAERYGIDVRLVREVRPLAGLTPVPGTAGWWSGLVNLRGSLCPVLSLQRYLRVAGAAPEADTRAQGVLVVVTAPFTAALLVDAAAEVRRIAPDTLRPVTGGAGDRAAAVQAVTDDLVQLLDPGVLPADPALVVGREAT